MAKAALPSPQEIAARQIRAVSGASENYRKGIQRVTTAPGQAAAAKKNAYLQGVQDNAAKWAANVAKVSLQDWAAAAIDKGAARLASGMQAAQPKLESFWSDFLPFLSSVQARVQSMPNDTFDQRVERMVANARGLRDFRRRS